MKVANSHLLDRCFLSRSLLAVVFMRSKGYLESKFPDRLPQPAYQPGLSVLTAVPSLFGWAMVDGSQEVVPKQVVLTLPKAGRSTSSHALRHLTKVDNLNLLSFKPPASGLCWGASPRQIDPACRPTP